MSSSRANHRTVDLIDRLVQAGPIRMPVAIVVAHPDDEIIAAGGTLTRFVDLTLIHVTDGASEDQVELRGLGFATRADYAAARREELDRALLAACVSPTRRLCLGVSDRQASNQLDEIVDRLASNLMGVDAIITHPYEGGHIDHDACARACYLACSRLQALTGRAPACLEFTSYFRLGGYVRTGVFWPAPESRQVEIALSASAVRRRESALRCFRSQAGNLRYFSTLAERFRTKPDYDFASEPPPVRYLARRLDACGG